MSTAESPGTAPQEQRPNILLIQADQLAARALGAYDNDVVSSPNIDSLADESTVFEHAYCASPLCAPSRASMLTGQLPSEIGAYDNAADFLASVPTFAHHLRNAGYHTSLVGRMHFIGPDQLHGFEERLTTDVYPAGLDMVPDWNLTADERLAWYHETGSVFDAGPSVTTVQLDFDNEVLFRTLRQLDDRVRAEDPRPFLVVASFIHPHDPYEPPSSFWHRYDDVDIDDPKIPPVDFDELDPHSQRLQKMCGFDQRIPSSEQVRRARRAYYASVSYVDDLVGRILARVDELGLRENTVIILTSDHGELLGERGMWYKMSPFEGSIQVPLMISAPHRLAAGRIDTPVSLLDILPTLTDLAEYDPGEVEGRSLLDTARGDVADRDIIVEYLAEGLNEPQVTLIRGPWKFVHCPGDPDQLFNLREDPDELVNVADEPAHQSVVSDFLATLDEKYDFEELDRKVKKSQSRRRTVQRALTKGSPNAWDHEPPVQDNYVRGDFWTAVNRRRIPAEDQD